MITSANARLANKNWIMLKGLSQSRINRINGFLLRKLKFATNKQM